MILQAKYENGTLKIEVRAIRMMQIVMTHAHAVHTAGTMVGLQVCAAGCAQAYVATAGCVCGTGTQG